MLQNWKKLVCDRYLASMRFKKMPQRARKLKYRQYSQESLAIAFESVKSGQLNLNDACAKYKIPEATLRHRLNGKVSQDCTNSGPPPLMSAEEEKIFVNHVGVMAKLGYEYRRSEIVSLASQYAVHLGVRDDEKPLSMKWFYNLKARWPNVPTLGTLRSMSILKSKAIKSSIIASYFYTLESIITEHSLQDKPQYIYNVDEKTLDDCKMSTVTVSKRGAVLPGVDLSSSTVTLISCGNADGTQIPPYFVFPGELMNPENLFGGSVGTAGEVTENGATDTQLFQSYIENHFLKNIPAGRPSDQYILMLYDGFRSHISLPLIEWAKSRNIILFVLPLHMTHAIEPKTDACMGPLRDLYNAECQRYMRKQDCASINRNKVCSVACKAYADALSPQSLVSGFKNSGINPLDHQIITDMANQNCEGIRRRRVRKTPTKRKSSRAISVKLSPAKKGKKNTKSSQVDLDEESVTEDETTSEEEILSSDEQEEKYSIYISDPERQSTASNESVTVMAVVQDLTLSIQGETVIAPQDVILDVLSPHLLGACETVVSTMTESADAVNVVAVKVAPGTSVETDAPFIPGTNSMAFITVPDMNVAKKLSHGLVKGRLAACVNIIPGVTSVYEWEGEVNEDPELLLMVKTATAKVDEVSKFIRENHPYDVAEVISAKIDNGNPPYLKWLSETMEQKPTKSDP